MNADSTNLPKRSRREFVKSTFAATTGISWIMSSHSHSANAFPADEKPRHKVERIGIGVIGLKYQGSVIAKQAKPYGDIVALCDVDAQVLDKAKAELNSTAVITDEYQKLLERKDIDVVFIGTPDHWHTKMLVDACRSGKDVYCEKPLTLTINEGKLIREVVQKSKQVVQVGTWQRSDHRFRLAVEMVRQGRIGKLKKVTCITDQNPSGGPFEVASVPKHFNWNLWQGQTPDVPYIPERSHYTFRWWYEYSGGKMTDWGAHHIDIAQWAIQSLPVEISSKGTHPKIQNGYNVASRFSANIRYANGVELAISDQGRRGILFEGDQGRIFVNRGTIAGKPVDELKSNPLPRTAFQAYDFDNLTRKERAGKLDAITNHMGNFFDCIEARKTPISDIESQHRSVSTCHLANISLRLGKSLKWVPKSEQFPDDPKANAMLSREQRQGFEVI